MDLFPRSYIRNIYMIREINKLQLPESMIDNILQFYDSRYQDSNIERIWYYLGRETCNIDKLSYVICHFLQQEFFKTKTKGFWMDDIFEGFKCCFHNLAIRCDLIEPKKEKRETFFHNATFYGKYMANLSEHLTSKQDVKKVISKENKEIITHFVERVLDYTEYLVYMKDTSTFPNYCWYIINWKEINRHLKKLNKKCYKILDFVNANSSK